jgi:hypothetical protein
MDAFSSRGLWCKRQDPARYDFGRAAGGVGMSKGFVTAAIAIAGIELMHRIRKGQFGLGRLGVQGRLAPAVWNAVLQA